MGSTDEDGAHPDDRPGHENLPDGTLSDREKDVMIVLDDRSLRRGRAD
jgi:hypothetical protein